jgi:hypothetical protein
LLLASPLVDRTLAPATPESAGANPDADALLTLADRLSESASMATTSEVTDLARHRNMTKFLLAILVLGSVIRFVTSQAYLEFIADVLDPKSF